MSFKSNLKALNDIMLRIGAEKSIPETWLHWLECTITKR